MKIVKLESSWKVFYMNKPKLEEIERDDNHVIFYLWQNIENCDLYDRAKAVDRFLTRESKVLERVIESELHTIFYNFGIIPQTKSKSALNDLFSALNRKGHDIVIIDRNKNADFEQSLGVSDNGMTLILEDKAIISFAMEIRVYDIKVVERV